MSAELSKREEERRQRQRETSALEDVWLSFLDLKRRGIVKNWQTLLNWQRDPKINFPPGKLFGPNSRRWSEQQEIEPWLKSRPIERYDAA
jgi:hypothetical protein